MSTKQRRKHRRTGRDPIGRPPKPFEGDPDLPVIGDALALQLLHKLSERAALDIAIGIHEGELAEPSKRPRAKRPADWELIGLALSPGKRFDNRNSTLRKKMKRMPRELLRRCQIEASIRFLRGPKK
jgi:hypothetical protein